MLQDVANLRLRNPGEPLKKLVNGGILLEVLEQRGNRHPCATEDPGTTHAIGVALDIGTGGPIDHGAMVAPGPGSGNQDG